MKNGKGFQSFLWIWGGQLGSVLGSSLTSFALGVYVLQKSGSVTNFSITLLCLTLPGIIIAPFAGILVDKWNRRGMMLLSDFLAGSATLGIGAILAFSHLTLWHIFLFACIASISGTIQFPAYQSIVSQIVEKRHLGRANGLIQLCEALTNIVAPPLGGVLLPLIHLKGIIIIDFFSFFLAIFSVLAVKIPKSQKKTETVKNQPLWADLKEGVHYLLIHKELLWFLSYFALSNFLFGFEEVYLQPLILSLSDVKNLGYVLSSVGFAMVAGGITISAWGGPKRKARGVFGFGFVTAFIFSFVGFSTSILLISILLFISFFFLPFGNSCSQVLWQTRVEPSIQGRVFALRRMIAMSLMPLAFFLSGPVSEHILTPFMSDGRAGNILFGEWLGTGQGAGFRLFFIIIGLGLTFLSILLYSKKEIRKIDEDSGIYHDVHPNHISN
ncbi:MAG: MFS transporter [Bacillota bacterium]|nr:MFS transporter [Bacillota bacterium]